MPKDLKAVATFTTGQISKLCDVAPRTVAKWIDSGTLPGGRIPGSQDRRVLRAAFVTFLRSNPLFAYALEQIGESHTASGIPVEDFPATV